MNRYGIILLLAILALFPSAQSQAQGGPRFDGGMMVHTGYLNRHISTLDYKAQGMTFGLGGALRFHIGNHLRVGGEGYVSTLKQMNNGSYIRTSWGGLLLDAYCRLGRWQPYAGVTVGGGGASSLLMFGGSADDWEPETNAILHEDSFFFVNPNIGVEYALTESVHLTCKVDRLVPLTAIEMPVGMRFYVGFIFAH